MQDVINELVKKKRPVIGITADYVEPKINGESNYSLYPWYAIQNAYIKTIVELGGCPFPLLCKQELIEDYIDKISGLIISGGHFDIDPKMYGEENIHPRTKINPVRGKFEFALVKEILKTKKPVLGICGGMQLLNVIYGGTLIQDIADHGKEYMDHLQKGPDNPHHEVEITDNSLLQQIVGRNRIFTNTSHHQAVENIGQSLKVNAVAIDGIVEGIEDPLHPFCMGVQWHPEWQISKADSNLISYFIEKCR